MNSITKEQAVELWFDFVNSPRSVLSTSLYGPGSGFYMYTIKAWGAHELKYEINLITYPPDHLDLISESTIKQLITPVGSFSLSVDETKKCAIEFVNKIKSKSISKQDSIDDIKIFLKK